MSRSVAAMPTHLDDADPSDQAANLPVEHVTQAEADDRVLTLLAVVRDLQDRVTAIEDAIRAVPVPAPRPTDDARFLAAIAASVRQHVFSAREIVNHATVDPELRAALDGVTSAKRIGKRLHRLAGHLVGGLRLCRVDRDRDGTIWLVQVVDDLHAND